MTTHKYFGKVWSKICLPLHEVGGRHGSLETFSLVITPLMLQPSQQGIYLLDLFGGIATDLVATLQIGSKIHKYHFY